MQRNPIYRNIADNRRRIANVPGATNFQRQFGGTVESGFSGIVPFVRTRSGNIQAPINTKRFGLKKFF